MRGMRSFEMVALALGFSLVVGCGSEGTSADDVGRLSAALCVEPRLTPLRVTASSSESASYSPERAADGNASTRWSSVFADSAWIQLDFGVARQLERVVLKWETAASKSYTLGISDSESGPFTTIYTQTNGKGGTETASGLHGSGRYLRLTSTARTTGFGISLFELEAYAPVDGACGSPSPKCGSAPPSGPRGPTLGVRGERELRHSGRPEPDGAVGYRVQRSGRKRRGRRRARLERDGALCTRLFAQAHQTFRRLALRGRNLRRRGPDVWRRGMHQSGARKPNVALDQELEHRRARVGRHRAQRHAHRPGSLDEESLPLGRQRAAGAGPRDAEQRSRR